MSHQPLAALIDELAAGPFILRGLCESMPTAKLRRKPAPGRFAPIEDIWHLRDIECEGHLVRIRRILSEDFPHLASLDGEQLAIDRRYVEREPQLALEEFSAARAEGLRLLAHLDASQWRRQGVFENKSIDLETLVAMMVEHDRGHFSSLRGCYVASRAA